MNPPEREAKGGSLPLSGERLLTTVENESVTEHLHRYAIARDYCVGKTVLDIASGEGYGSALLAKQAGRVIGMDIDSAAVAHAAGKYVRPNLEYRAGSCTAIPLDDASVDIVVSFETIEHHDRHEEMLREVKRVLRPQGLCIISTPDRDNYSTKRNYENPFHVKELSVEEFRGLVGKHFANVVLAYQSVCFGSLIMPESPSSGSGFVKLGGNFTDVGPVRPDALYCIAFASDAVLPALGSSFFDGDAVLQKRLDAILSSASYRLGHALLQPGRILSRILRGRG